MKIKGQANYKPGPKDECGTPRYAINIIKPFLKDYIKYISGDRLYDLSVWEPATGERHYDLVDSLLELDYDTYFDTGDFLTADIPIDENGCLVDIIITNPPFSVGLKRAFIKKCRGIYNKYGIPFALLMKTNTISEKVNRQYLNGCNLVIPYGRINYSMPNKGWGTPDNPTKATFDTAWFCYGFPVGVKNQIYYSDLDISNHFKLMEGTNNENL